MGLRLVVVLLVVLVASDFAKRLSLPRWRFPCCSQNHSNESEGVRGAQLTSLRTDGPCASHTSSGCEQWISTWTSSLFGGAQLRFIMVFKISDCGDIKNEAEAAFQASDVDDFPYGELGGVIDVLKGFQEAPTKNQTDQDDWVALVQEKGSSKIIAYFRGRTSEKGIHIDEVESNSNHHIGSAASWGFSMLLHRLHLRGGAKAVLQDASGHGPGDLVKLRGTNTLVTKGSLIYGGTWKEKHPYTFEVATSHPVSITARGQRIVTYDYTYELGSERYGEDYVPNEPC